jgi:hypothetical protein
MANHAEGLAPGALVRFGSLDFIVTIGGGLEHIHVLVRPTRTANLGPVVEAFEGMRLRARRIMPPRIVGPLTSIMRVWGIKLHVFMGPRPTLEDLHHVLFSLANIMAQLSGGETLSLEIPTMGVPKRLPFSLPTRWRTRIVLPRRLLVHPPQTASSWG